MKLIKSITVIVFTNILLGTTLFVSTDGSDESGFGTEENPFATIQHGLDVAGTNDTVSVATGTYIENIIWPATNGIKLIGEDRETTIIDGDSLSNVIRMENISDTSTEIRNFTITNGFTQVGNPVNSGGGIHLSYSHPTLTNLTITGNYASNLAGGLYIVHSDPIVSDALISNNTSYSLGGGSYLNFSNALFSNVIIEGNTSDQGGGLALWGSDPQLENVFIHNNSAVGDGGGIYNDASSNPTLTNVTITENSTGSFGGGISCRLGSGISIINSIIWDNELQEVAFWGTYAPNSITISYSDIEGGEDAIETNDNGTVNWLDGNIDSDPRFVNPEEGDYRLLANSFCINAGHPDSTDADGSRADMGAYPYLNWYEGDQWYVNTVENGGSDIWGTGSADSAFASIQAGLNFAGTNDTVNVSAGTYVENVVWPTYTEDKYGIQLLGEDRETTIIDGDANGSVMHVEWVDSTSYMSGFTLQNGSAENGGGLLIASSEMSFEALNINNNTSTYGGGIHLSGAALGGGAPPMNSSDWNWYIHMENIVISDNVAGNGGGIRHTNYTTLYLNNSAIENNSASTGGGVYYNQYGSSVYENVLIRGNSASNSAAIYIRSISTLYTNNCVITGNINTSGGGYVIRGMEYASFNLNNTLIADNVGGGLIIQHNSLQSSYAILDKVTVSGNISTNGLDSGVKITSPNSDAYTNISNSIIYGNGNDIQIHIDPDADPTVNIEYSDIQGGVSGITQDVGTVNWLDGNIDTDPRFVNPDSSDYRLLANSFCINTGHPDSTDTDGSRADMGAYPYLNEYTGTDWYVNTVENGGSDIWGTGSADSAFASIQAGLNFAGTNDTVNVSAGRYYENIQIPLKDLVLQSIEGPDSTIIDGGGVGSVITYDAFSAIPYTNASKLKGFTIENGYAESGGGIYCYNAPITLDDLIIGDNSAMSGGGIYAAYSDISLSNSVLHSNSAGNSGGGLDFNNSQIVLEEVSFYGNIAGSYGGAVNMAGSGADLIAVKSVFIGNSSDGYGGAIFANNSLGANTVNQCTFVENTAYYGGGIYFNNVGGFINNSIFTGNTPSNEQIMSSEFAIEIQYSLVENGYDGFNIIDTDPLFTDPGNGDFTLQWGSPCINAGNPESGIDPDGSWPDMGAYPFDLYTGALRSADVTINEIMFDPDGTDSKREYFELYNPGELPVWMMGWSFEDSNEDNRQTVDNPNIIILPNDLVVFARDDDLEDNGGFIPDFVYSGFTFSNSGEELHIYEPVSIGGNEMDFIEFSDELGFPISDSDNAGMELIIPTLENSNGRNWGASVDTVMLDYGSGTPGAPNSTVYNRPVAHSGADVTTTDSDGDGFVPITLDGSDSDDPVYGDPLDLAFTWLEEFYIDITFDSLTGMYSRDTVYTGVPISTGEITEVELLVGEYSIILDVVDDSGLWDQDTVYITILPAPANLVINEFMINTGDLEDSLGEFVEIINLGNDTVDLRSYTLFGSEGETHTINSENPVIVEPQSYFLLGVTEDWSDWSEIVSGPDYVYPYSDFSLMDFVIADEEGLGEFSDTIGLLSPFGQIIDEVVYTSDWDVVEDGEGISIELKSPEIDNSLEDSWVNADEDLGEYGDDLYGTPGYQNTTQYLTAGFSADTTSIIAGQTVQFTDESVASGVEIGTWQWDFGDDSSSSESSPAHSYSNAGMYSVSLTVTSEDGTMTDTETKIDYITVIDADPGCTDPAADNFNDTANIEDGSCVYIPVNLIAVGGDGEIILNWEDGGASLLNGNDGPVIMSNAKNLNPEIKSQSKTEILHTQNPGIQNDKSPATGIEYPTSGTQYTSSDRDSHYTYKIYRDEEPYAEGITELNFTDTGLGFLESHTYTVRQVNDGEQSGHSEEATVSTNDCAGDQPNENNAQIDDCGNCFAGSTGLEENYAMDDCGICDGDNSTCTGCMEDSAENYDPDAILPCDDCCTYDDDYVWFVSMDGDNENDGLTPDSAVREIQYAIDSLASTSDTIVVAPGTYLENISITKTIAVVTEEYYNTGASSDLYSTVIDGGGGGSVITLDGVGSTTLITGFTITNGSAVSGGGISISNTSVPGPILDHLIITGNTATGDSWWGGSGIYAEDSEFRGNRLLIFGNISEDFGGGVLLKNSTADLNQVTIVDNEATNGGGVFAWFESTIKLHNSILWGNGPQQIAFGGDDGLNHGYIYYTDLEGGVVGIDINLNANLHDSDNILDADPLFDGFYHLTWEDFPEEESKSPCIDAGDPDSEWDPDGTVADLGMFIFEYLNPNVPSNMFVDGNGGNDDFGDGSYDNPFASIQIAVNASSDNPEITHIVISDGTYNENVIINHSIILTSYYIFDGDSSHIENTIISGATEGDEENFNGSCILVYPLPEDDNRDVIVVEIDGLTLMDGFGTYVEITDDPDTPEDETDLYDATSFWAGGGICGVNCQIIANNNIFSGNGFMPISGPFIDHGGAQFLIIGLGIGVGRNQTGDPPDSREELGFVIENNTYSGNVASIGSTMDVRGLGGEVVVNDSHLDVMDTGDDAASEFWFTGDSEVQYTFSGSTGELDAQRGTIRVSSVGNDATGDGSEDAPYASLNKAMSMVYGTFDEPAIIQFDEVTVDEDETGNRYPLQVIDHVTLEGAGRGVSVLDGGGVRQLLVFDNAENAAVKNATIRNGNKSVGGGIKVINSNSIILEDIAFEENEAIKGAGLYSRNASVELKDVEFKGNTAANSGGEEVNVSLGGGMYIRNSSIVLENVPVLDNMAAGTDGRGGGMYIYNKFGESSTIEVKDLEIRGNQAAEGGGIYIDGVNPVLKNLVISGNYSPGHGGGIYCDNAGPVIINCTITGNFSYEGSSGLYIANGSNPVVVNSILWNNFDKQVKFKYGVNSLNILESDLQGGIDGITLIEDNTVNGDFPEFDSTILDSDPLFVLPLDPSDIPTEDGDFHLTENSPCINEGISSFEWDDEIILDLTEGEDFLHGAPDLGAYETNYSGAFTQTIEDLHVGANLVSFYVLPEDASISNVMSSLGTNVDGVIGEGVAASQIEPGNWVGSLSDIERTSGYWLKMGIADTFEISGIKTDPSIEYELNVGANLISYPSDISLNLTDALPDTVECLFDGLIGEGVAASQISCQDWVGSLSQFDGGKGYWAKVTEDLSFSFEIDGFTRVTDDTEPSSLIPEPWTYNQSTEQAFYFIEDVQIDGLQAANFWLLAYCGETLVGAREWTGAYTDVPAMGTDSYDETAGYCEADDVPQFYLLQNGDLIPLEGEIPAWQENEIFIISLSGSTIEVPTEFALKPAYPNPFNPVTTFEYGLPNATNVSLVVYDISGRVISELVNGELDAGYHSVQWNAFAFSSGIYFVQLQTQEFSTVRKLLLLK